MNPLSSSRLALVAASCAVLLGCAGTTPPANPGVSRTPPPQDYEKTITSYFAFRVRGPQKNTVINFAPPEPGACALDGHAASMRGWVVPVVFSTRSGQGLSTVNIDAKQYYFWFLGNTIAGITPRQEQCPGIGVTLTELSPPIVPAGGFAAVALPTGPAATREPREAPTVAAPTRPRSASRTAQLECAEAVGPRDAPVGRRRPRRGDRRRAGNGRRAREIEDRGPTLLSKRSRMLAAIQSGAGGRW